VLDHEFVLFVLAVADRRPLLAYAASNAQACQCMRRRSGSEIEYSRKRFGGCKALAVRRHAYNQENTQAMACLHDSQLLEENIERGQDPTL
jgi:hypothetical protein